MLTVTSLHPVPACRQVGGQLIAHVEAGSVLGFQRDGTRQRPGTSIDAYGDGGRQDPGAAALGELGQLAAPVGFGAGFDIEQAEYPDHHVRVNVDRLPPLVAVRRRHAVCRGQLAQAVAGW